jgi:hypothetical protein
VNGGIFAANIGMLHIEMFKDKTMTKATVATKKFNNAVHPFYSQQFLSALQLSHTRTIQQFSQQPSGRSPTP